MKKIGLLFVFVLSTLIFLSQEIYAKSSSEQSLPLKRVVISTGGIALYEHSGQVSNDTSLELPADLDQVDDMLKSLLVLDNKGSIGGISLPGKEPLSRSFKNLPFSLSDISDLKRLLNALRGASVDIDGKLKGRLLGISEEKKIIDDSVTTVHRISIVTDSGIKTAILENIASLNFTDKKVQAQIDRALNDVFQNRVHDKRNLSIDLKGKGTREVGLIYLREAPLWKSSYRLVLPADQDIKTADMQAWAVMENITGIDWKDVSVTLVSGSPVMWSQSLYESYYTDRPNLPVKIMDRIMPRTDEGEQELLEQEEKSFSLQKSRRVEMINDSYAPSMAMSDSAIGFSSRENSGFPPSPSYSSSANMASGKTAIAETQASQMIFSFPDNVNLPSGHSLMVPFIAGEISAQRIYVYQRDTNDRHPLSAVEIENKSESGYPPGILTLYSRSKNGLVHVGDAEMPLIPKGDSRLISFALDSDTIIDSDVKNQKTEGLVSVSQGIMQQKVNHTRTTEYTITAPEYEKRTIIIEHPEMAGWELITPKDISEEVTKSKSHYRIKTSLDAGETKKISVTMKKEGQESITLLHMNPEGLKSRINAMSSSQISDDLRRKLEKLQEYLVEVNRLETELNQNKNAQNQLTNDQERIRRNLSSVPRGSTLHSRYLDKMDEQEDDLEDLLQAQDKLMNEKNKAQEELEKYIKSNLW